MSGNKNKLLLDTNAFIYFFEGGTKITNLVLKNAAIYFSVISEIELLSAPHLSPNEISKIETFLSLCQRIELTSDIVSQSIQLRRAYRLKTPDAIVAATAIIRNISLVTADTGFQRIQELALISDILPD